MTSKLAGSDQGHASSSSDCQVGSTRAVSHKHRVVYTGAGNTNIRRHLFMQVMRLQLRFLFRCCTALHTNSLLPVSNKNFALFTCPERLTQVSLQISAQS